MAIPASLVAGLQLPVVAAPMFLVSGPELVMASCRAGIIGTLPALNQRSTQGLTDWLLRIKEALSQAESAAFGVNLIVHHGNARLEADLQVCCDQRVPLIITSLGLNTALIGRIHAYGGLVFHDVTTLRHAHKAAEAGVDGLILVCAGAGGHAGLLNPFAFVAAVRQFFNGTVVLAGCINSGHEIAAVQVLGADLVYMGTRFIATQESRASDDYKQMILRAEAADIVYTPAVSGVPGNFLVESLQQAGVNPEHVGDASQVGAELAQQSVHKAWRDVWSAGQGVGAIDDVPAVAELVTRLRHEHSAVWRSFSSSGSNH